MANTMGWASLGRALTRPSTPIAINQAALTEARRYSMVAKYENPNDNLTDVVETKRIPGEIVEALREECKRETPTVPAASSRAESVMAAEMALKGLRPRDGRPTPKPRQKAAIEALAGKGGAK